MTCAVYSNIHYSPLCIAGQLSCKKVSLEGPEEEAPIQWIQCSACKFWLHYKCSGKSVPYHLVDKSIIYCDICDSV